MQQPQQSEICSCGVPYSNHGTACGWNNAKFSEMNGIICTPGHPFQGRHFNEWTARLSAPISPVEEIGQKLKRMLEKEGLTPKNALDKTGISLVYLDRLENGELKSHSASVLYKLSELYKIDLKPLLVEAGVIIKKSDESKPSPVIEIGEQKEEPTVKELKELLHAQLSVYEGLCYRLPKEERDKFLRMPSYVQSTLLIHGEDISASPPAPASIVDEAYPVLRWVKASERLPELPGKENSVIIRGKGFGKDQFGHDHPYPFVTTGFRNFDEKSPKFYFVIGHHSFLTNENIEWLEEITVPEADQLTIEDYIEVLADKDRLVREIDVVINGVNAARQASLCDLVGQIEELVSVRDARKSAPATTDDNPFGEEFDPYLMWLEQQISDAIAITEETEGSLKRFWDGRLRGFEKAKKKYLSLHTK